MADSRVSDLTESTTPATSDVLYVVVGGADRKVQVSNLVAAVYPAWTSYTPTWTASGSNPAIGNGTIKGAYLLVGKMLHFRVSIVMGSTTTYGSGDYRVTMPTGTAKTSAGVRQIFAAWYYHTSTGSHYPGVGRADSGATTLAGFTAGSGGVSALVGASYPFTFASGDEFHCSGVIEVD